MKRNIAWILLLVVLLGIFACCKKNNNPGMTSDNPDIHDAIVYLQNLYKDDGAQTPADYERLGIVLIAGISYPVAWTVDISDEMIKVVSNDDGITIIDICKRGESDTPYKLTATITGRNGDTASHHWNYILPAADNMLATDMQNNGNTDSEGTVGSDNVQKTPYETMLSGCIISIDKPYDSLNDNVTVTILVKDQENKRVVCYDLKGSGVDQIDVNDLITVKGYIESAGDIDGYKVEKLASGCQLLKWEDRNINEISIPTDPVEILEAAYNLDANTSLAYEATLTGAITKVNTAYDAVYDNVTIVLTVTGCEDKPIVCYRMKGDGVSKIDIGDTITVKGYIKNYINESGLSIIQFDSPTLISYKKNASNISTNPVDIVNAAYALEAGAQLPYKVTLSGEVLIVNDAYSSDYNNVTVTIQVSGVMDKPIKCYRMIGADVDKIGVGDTITVNGYIEKFQHLSGNTEVAFVFGCVMTQWSNTGEDIPVTTQPPAVKDEPDATNPPTIDNEIPTTAPVIDEQIPTVTDPTVSAEYVKGVAAGTKYYMGFNNGTRMYFDGKVASSGITCRLSATENLADAVQVMVESVSGGYLLYFMNGQTKTYIRIYERLAAEAGKGKGGVELVTTEPAEALVFDSAVNTLVYKADDNNSYYLGTYDTYTTISVSNIASVTGENAFMLDVDQYPVRFYTS